MENPTSRPGPGPTPAPLRELGPGDPARVGRYRIEAKAGEGGMGAVYLGRAPDGGPVAVKVVRAALAGDRTFLARFHDEAAHAERVASFCTAQVLEHGEDAGVAYLVTEYIDGPSLLQRVADGGPLSPGMLHGVAVGVAAALVAIHAAGLVHRDLKPSNVLLSMSGPRVIDFGIARALDAASAHTRTGQVVGTPGWIAPEQILTQQVSPAVDVFAWGCLVVFAAGGRNPFGQGTFQVMAARVVHAEPELGDLPGPLAGLVRAALAKDPEHRPTAQELLLALVGGSTETDVSTTLGESWTPPQPPPPSPPPIPPPSPSPSSGVTSQDAAAPDARHGSPPPPHPATEVAPPPQSGTSPIGEGRTESPQPVMPTVPPAPPARRAWPRRKGPLAVGAAVLLVGAVTGNYLLTRPDDGSRMAAKTTGGFPAEPLLVRIDTAPGWPKTCHGDIGTYAPGAAAPTTLVGGPTCDSLPQYSPDRKRVAFTRKNGDKTEAWVMNADGGGPRRVTDALAGGRVTWSEDGRRLAYMGERADVRQIYRTAIDGGAAQPLTTDPSDKDDPMCSPQGRLVFWSKRDGAEQLYSLDAERPAAPWTRITRDGVRAVDPAWSPDGSKIAYSRGAYPGGDIWIVNADGSAPHRVTRDPAHEMDPSWSRDGRWIAFTRGTWDRPVIHAIRADGTGERRITPPGRTLGHPGW
ncbi:protein kinase domain-containing protein [Actinomadura xylanilytica]|uniref:protein kinase domain-containing protein n=1 Tax=Actinomadura xylanilytica TaxID=887459 RepID=UPI00255A7B3E|nr:protein kinase [Actinomadura xylanilytica]MDL4774396.1 protein kinase [Actinomadura xylanilytica]